MKLRDGGIFDVNNNVHCADDGVHHGDCRDLSEGADGGVGVDDGDCSDSDLSEGADDIGADDGDGTVLTTMVAVISVRLVLVMVLMMAFMMATAVISVGVVMVLNRRLCTESGLSLRPTEFQIGNAFNTNLYCKKIFLETRSTTKLTVCTVSLELRLKYAKQSNKR